MKKFCSTHNVVLASLWAALAVVSPVAAQHEENPDAVANQQPGFLEIARNPNANPALKRTIAAMMDFVRETDPEPALEKLKALDTFVLYGGGDDGLTDLMPLSQLTKLETLVLFNHNLSDITPLGSLINLKTLRLEANQIRDISPLASLRKLESLQIDDNRVSDLRPLSGLSLLRTLWISRNQISDISPLKGLKQLRDLHLSGNKVTDLKILADMSLQTLNLDGNGLTDISDLRAMNQSSTGFISLNLSGNAIRDIGPLGELPGLTSLDLADNRITNADELNNPSLKWLSLEGNRLSRVPDLRKFNLSSINLRRNPIKDYTDLVAYKKENPMVEILADEEFTLAFEAGIPVRKDLEGSPLLGIWRSDRIESEWGPVILELRFRPNGIVYQVMLPAEPGQDLEPEGEGWKVDGRFTVTDNRLELTFGKNGKQWSFVIENEVLTMEADGNKISYRRIKG